MDEEVEECGRLDEEEIKAVTKQVLDGLCYLHVHGFLHVSHMRSSTLSPADGLDPSSEISKLAIS